MIHVFFDERGSGKSKNLINRANEEAMGCKGNIVYIDDDNKRMLQLDNKIRFISMKDYGVNGEEQFYGFLCGILSRDFDIEHIYIDGLSNILSVMEEENVEKYFCKLEEVCKKFGVNVYINVHSVDQKVPECIRKYVA